MNPILEHIKDNIELPPQLNWKITLDGQRLTMDYTIPNRLLSPIRYYILTCYSEIEELISFVVADPSEQKEFHPGDPNIINKIKEQAELGIQSFYVKHPEFK